MRWGLVAAAVAVLIAAPAGGAARSQLTIQATPSAGAAPLTVTFTAGGASSAQWDFGDGASADGVTVAHAYAAGRWTATATAKANDGTSSAQSVQITAYGLTLAGPSAARYARRALFRGAVVPAEQGVAVTLSGPNGKVGSAKTGVQGTYAIRGLVRGPGRVPRHKRPRSVVTGRGPGRARARHRASPAEARAGAATSSPRG